MSNSPFVTINALNNKTPLESLDGYNQFLTTRFYSYFRETILIANEANKFQGLEDDLHFAFYDSIIEKRKRFSKWYKGVNDELLNVIAEYYDISLKKAKDVMKILTDEQKAEIVNYVKEKNNE